MEISNIPPQSWQELQARVCKYLNEAGYSAEECKIFQSARGNVEIDVYAIKSNPICDLKFV